MNDTVAATPTLTADGSLSTFLTQPSRFLFFTGKGGVGKTSLACATSVALADQGKRVLLVSTDPASNLDEVLGQKLNGEPTPIAGVSNLLALNIDPAAAAATYRERLVGPYRGKLPEAVVRGMEEQLSGACTLEIAAFDQSFAESGSRDPLLVARGADEVPYIREVAEKLSQRTAIVPWFADEPVGPEKLRQLLS